MSTALGAPWVEKYRPETFQDIISHEDIMSTLMVFAEKGQLPHLLFHGPPGAGKTSTIMAIARYLYGSQRNGFVLELNASDERGIDTVREQIKSFSETSNTFSSTSANEDPPRTTLKLIILDEADQMTNAAQNALRRIMEIYSNNVRFCLICNFMNKIIPPIQSRCTGFRFQPLKPELVRQKIKDIAAIEKVSVSECALDTLVDIGQGDMRRVLNCLQVTAMSYAKGSDVVIDSNLILATSGLPKTLEIDHLLQSLMQNSFKECVDELNELHHTKGYSVEDLVRGVYKAVLKIDWPNVPVIQLLIRLADIEERLSSGANTSIQIAALVSSFAEARYEIEKIKFDIKNS
ncbi:replication factor C subunit [Theileria orientalis strain Shintoku]|uniref:Replication factor C subunit n=1 Tax=Theileria orientalis strain Shintoku TaxID=869250 RepID=J4DQC2_THEOR|nr:replication factor C subunit [Theileria orientalis strain Shintoku]PVC54683.1 replication factor C subunit [Theileria orientalis]BAM42199.1 replication factor C subunit [Theileria orientalis strain Shintoku]|eukprot:XP_009692500.1 replication factor C subunit [Theileria orientalis strain Shintoku]